MPLQFLWQLQDLLFGSVVSTVSLSVLAMVNDDGMAVNKVAVGYGVGLSLSCVCDSCCGWCWCRFWRCQ